MKLLCSLEEAFSHVTLSYRSPLSPTGLDAIERVLSKAKNVGMGDIGKDYPLSPTMRKIPDWAEDKAEEAKDEGKSLIQKLASVVV